MDEAAICARIARTFDGLVAPEARLLEDDAATLPPVEPGHTRVISADNFVEGRHFRADHGPLQSAGHRAIRRNLGDLAAMGARPVGFLWTLAIPPAWLEGASPPLFTFCEGAAKLCARVGLSLFGGDLTRIDGPFCASVTVVGDVRGEPLGRAGAAPGDALFLSAPLGASAGGLLALEAGHRGGPLVDAHLFGPDIADGQSLVDLATSCIDVSDGLARDLHRIARASKVRAVLDALDDAIDPLIASHEHAADLVRFGGEDHALLFTAPPDRAPLRAIRIGRVEAGEGVRIESGDESVPLPDRGWDHFG